MDAAGGVPILRGIASGLGAIPQIAWWEGRHAQRAARGPVRATWPALAAHTPAYGDDRPHPGARAGGLQHTGRASRGPARVIPERESLELLRAAGVPIVPTLAVEGASAAGLLAGANEAATTLRWPVAVKVDAPGLSHKTDVGAVELGVAGPREMASVLRRLWAAGRDHDPDGVLVQPMARAGVELIVGAQRDPQFGPLILVGLGGIHAEVLDDVALRLVPIDAADAREMLAGLRGERILDGVRGRRPVDRESVVRLLVALSRAVERHPEWREVDINPVIAAHAPHGAIAVDALITADPEDPGGADA
jgi:hypothetical protein